MSNLIENFRLDEHRREILKMRITSLGIKKSQYFRTLIDRDNVGRFRKPTNDAYEEWKAIRAEILLSDTKKALLEALKKEFESGEKTGRKVKTLLGVCKKYGLDKRIAINDLNDLIEYDIFIKKKTESKYNWTLQGIIIIPEYAFSLSNEKFLFFGDMASLLAAMLGEYDDVLRYFRKMGLTKEDSKAAFNIVLEVHVKFITWIREVSFSSLGIVDPDHTQFYRKQMLHFLFNYLLMSNENQQTSPEFDKDLCVKLIKVLANYFSKTVNIESKT